MTKVVVRTIVRRVNRDMMNKVMMLMAMRRRRKWWYWPPIRFHCPFRNGFTPWCKKCLEILEIPLFRFYGDCCAAVWPHRGIGGLHFKQVREGGWYHTYKLAQRSWMTRSKSVGLLIWSLFVVEVLSRSLRVRELWAVVHSSGLSASLYSYFCNCSCVFVCV